MLLMSADRAQEFAEFSPAAGALRCFDAAGADQPELQAGISGRYALVDGTRVLFYREGETLKLRLGGETYEVDADVTAGYERGGAAALIEQVPGRRLRKRLSRLLGAENTFRLLRRGSVILTFTYAAPLRELRVFDPTPFMDDEDFDFMLFVHNVINSAERRDAIWRSHR